MADKNGDPKLDLQEKKIPVFTVLKNNSILKNIFLLDNPPSISDSNSTENGDVSNRELEEILLVGRHPDCNITLEHPSISRYHLRIHSKPSSQDLAVVDLSSVHGTWVCGKKIEPGVPVHLKEGDSMQLGGSSRVYRLHWVPLNRAYDLDDPFVPPEAQVTVPVKEMVEETHEEEDSLSREDNQIQLMGDELESFNLSFPKKNLKSCLKKVSPSGPPMSELLHSSSDDDDELQGFDVPVKEIVEETHQEEDSMSHENNQIQLIGDELESSNLSFPNKNLKSCLKKVSPSAPPLPELLHSSSDNDDELQGFDVPVKEIVEETHQEEDSMSHEDNQIHLIGDELESSNLSFQNKDLKLCSSDDGDEFPGFDVENQTPQILSQLECSKHSSDEDQGKFCSSRMEGEQEEISRFSCEPILTGYSSSSSTIVYSMSEDQNNSNEENSIIVSSAGRKSAEKSILSENSSESAEGFYSIGELIEAVVNENFETESNTPQSFTSTVSQNEDSKEQSYLPNIWLRRGKPTAVQIQISNSRDKDETHNVDDISNKSMSKFSEDGEEETFTPDKENFTPNTLLLRSMKKENKMEEITSKSSLKSGNQTKAEPEVMKRSRVVTRVPFQSLLVNSTTIEKNNIGGKNKRWVMVVDTNCLLNKESRKALKLLQGLKGTQLFIPRTVLRELDSMKRRGSLFRRETEACSALQWIEECMVNTKWWIQIQSTSEDGRLLAPTPTTLSPACGAGLSEIVSPTSQDNILECGLALRRIKNDGHHLVLLSHDVTLKIKAMAEGLLCEGAEEFRETLVNPFSERFLWADSSPRGPTWCCKDDVVLKENYERNPLRKKVLKLGEGAGAVKGLKLILLHSYQYRHITC